MVPPILVGRIPILISYQDAQLSHPISACEPAAVNPPLLNVLGLDCASSHSRRESKEYMLGRGRMR
jgi:hypothetical protein